MNKEKDYSVFDSNHPLTNIFDISCSDSSGCGDLNGYFTTRSKKNKIQLKKLKKLEKFLKKHHRFKEKWFDHYNLVCRFLGVLEHNKNYSVSKDKLKKLNEIHKKWKFD